ncbi:hypothetical protein MXD61_14405 [Frankia sp. AgPm24]|uniref:Transmembrane protein n=1 Tax=Frankia umida TaxID=573489 RepID=A0ABT0JZW9_9ACTN|nr:MULTISPECIES: hypothetical protein [Frankia]MCK9877070.1 hypothetical protein [Frankia umida]MCK9923048.1 hypothetical protein [Frankia sp. AgPm24]
MRRGLVTGIGAITLLGAGAYFFVYLYRWEWNRALISGGIFIAVEMMLIAVTLLNRISRLTSQVNSDSDRRHRIETRLREAPAPRSAVFDWMRADGSSAPVFIPILMGAGLLLSGLAWVVERLARATAGGTADAGVAATMARLGPPPGGLLDTSLDPLRLLRQPSSPR